MLHHGASNVLRSRSISPSRSGMRSNATSAGGPGKQDLAAL